MGNKTQIIRLMDIQDKLVKNGNTGNLEKLHKAYVYAATKHRGQLRQSGEPYLSHPLHVAFILAEMNMDLDTVIAGLLHDTVEDTDATSEELTEQFGKDVAFLVDGVTKIGQIQFKSKEEKLAENFRKMLMSMSKDVRVIIIKLADRLHNMQTIDFLRQEKKERIAQETLEIFAPLAHRLGIAWIKWELEDLAFRILHPDAYYEVHQRVKLKRTEREQYLDGVKNDVSRALAGENILANVNGRPKHFYSIYTKMQKKKMSFEEIYDLLALRILVDSVPQCYTVLGILHAMWKPIPGRFKDYIAMPKPNMYQSLHTTVIGPKGVTVEFQIRTMEMHRIAEEGIAAHWKYKEGKAFDPKSDKEFVWLRQLLEQKELNEPTDFVDALKEDILPTQIYVFTPAGDVIELPVGSTPIDFAFAIHTQVGNKCTGAKIEGRMVPLKYRLKNGDKVEVLTSPNQEPRKDWLAFVKTSRAKARIRSYLRKKESDHAHAVGIELLEKEFDSRNLVMKEYLDDSPLTKKVFDKLSVPDLENLAIQIGFGRESARHVVNLFVPQAEKEFVPHVGTTRKSASEPFVIQGIDNMLVSMAGCCNPIPGDTVKGYISRGRGIIVHKADCQNLANSTLHEDRLIEVRWADKDDYRVKVTFNMSTDDRPGMLSSVTSLISEYSLNIVEFAAKPGDSGIATQRFTVEVKNRDQVQQLKKRLESTKGVRSVTVM